MTAILDGGPALRQKAVGIEWPSYRLEPRLLQGRWRQRPYSCRGCVRPLLVLLVIVPLAVEGSAYPARADVRRSTSPSAHHIAPARAPTHRSVVSRSGLA